MNWDLEWWMYLLLVLAAIGAGAGAWTVYVIVHAIVKSLMKVKGRVRKNDIYKSRR